MRQMLSLYAHSINIEPLLFTSHCASAAKKQHSSLISHRMKVAKKAPCVPWSIFLIAGHKLGIQEWWIRPAELRSEFGTTDMAGERNCAGGQMRALHVSLAENWAAHMQQ